MNLNFYFYLIEYNNNVHKFTQQNLTKWYLSQQRNCIINKEFPAGNFNFEKALRTEEYFDARQKSVEISNFDIDSTSNRRRYFNSFYRASKKRWKIDVEISTVSAGKAYNFCLFCNNSNQSSHWISFTEQSWYTWAYIKNVLLNEVLFPE